MKQLRGIKPEDRPPGRAKILLTGEAKVGKSLASLDMPYPYVIDDEGGTRHAQYARKIAAGGGRAYEPANLADAIEEIKTLAETQHDYKTLTIDPLTTLYDKEVEIGSGKVGTEYGRHYEYANRNWKRLYRLVAKIDMNVIIICHTKKLTDRDGKIVAELPNGPKDLEYLFDLWIHLTRDENRRGGRRLATVKGSRLEQFKEAETFEWSFEEFTHRYGAENLERGCTPITFASEEQLYRFYRALAMLNDEEKRKLRIDAVIEREGGAEFLTSERIDKGTELIENHVKAREEEQKKTRVPMRKAA
jgi:hypothetical protein